MSTNLNPFSKKSVFSYLHTTLPYLINLKIPIEDSVHFVLTVMLSVTILYAFTNVGGLLIPNTHTLVWFKLSYDVLGWLSYAYTYYFDHF